MSGSPGVKVHGGRMGMSEEAIDSYRDGESRWGRGGREAIRDEMRGRRVSDPEEREGGGGERKGQRGAGVGGNEGERGRERGERDEREWEETVCCEWVHYLNATRRGSDILIRGGEGLSVSERMVRRIHERFESRREWRWREQRNIGLRGTSSSCRNIEVYKLMWSRDGNRWHDLAMREIGSSFELRMVRTK
ncbi:hypothetical protein Tco_0261205 [Tanacetum coccineum]